jgi:hypothetical protein
MERKDLLARVERLKIDTEAHKEVNMWHELIAWLGALSTPAYAEFMLSLNQFAKTIGHSLEDPKEQSEPIHSLQSELLRYYILSSWKAAQLKALMVEDEPKA